MMCPKCGFEQAESPECARCGVFVAKFLEKARLADEQRMIQDSIAENQVRYALPRGGAVEAEAGDDGFFAPEKKGIEHGMMGGMVMMAIAAVWFGLGWMAGAIFYYPPILFLIGVFAFLKGLFTGNVSG